MDVKLEGGIRVRAEYHDANLVGMVHHAGRHDGHQVAKLEIDLVGIPPPGGRAQCFSNWPLDGGRTDDSRTPASRHSVTHNANQARVGSACWSPWATSALAHRAPPTAPT